jgi:CheY-like chemotaxis protein/nitrogen-specific signal transduction histidine kinase
MVNLTERKRAERLVEEAREEADRANHAKDEFLSRMSHELRTPLNAVIGFAQLLELERLPNGQRDSVGQILRGGRHLLELINEVLDISRIESGTLTISPEPVSVREAVRDVMALIEPLAKERGLRLETTGLPQAAYVQADRQRLRQVLLNLLSNAVKFNRPGGAVILAAEPVAGPDGAEHLRVSVTDQGAGIDPAMHERVFAAFDRLGAERSGVEGTGLGLSVSKALLEAMGGRIGVESARGNGTTFWFSLPLVSRASLSNATRAQVEATPMVGLEISARERTLLYIEDNPSNFRLVELALERRPGFRLIAAMLGGLGLELAHQHRPDLVLLDLHLPDLEGEEVLTRLRADPATAGIPVVVLSAEASPRVRERLMAIGATDYLAKPIDLAEFYQVIDLHAGLAHRPGTEQ